MAKSLLDLVWPVAGLDRRLAYQRQPPFSTPESLNVRPSGTIQERARGGSRPGLVKAYLSELGQEGGSPIRMLAQVTVVRTDGFTYWADRFSGDAWMPNRKLDPVWSVASWVGHLPNIFPYDEGDLKFEPTHAGMVRDSLPIDSSKPYQIELDISPFHGSFGGMYRIYARLDNSEPDARLDGIVAGLVMKGIDGSYDGRLDVYVAGGSTTYNFTAGTIGSAKAGSFVVAIDGDNVKCYWHGNVLLDQNIASQSGKRFGLEIESYDAGRACVIEMFRIQYYSTVVQSRYRTILVASAGGFLYKENVLGELEKFTTDVKLADDRPIQAEARAQRLYIADWSEERVAGSGTGDLDATGLELTDTGVADWTAFEIDKDRDVCVIYEGSVSVVNGSYEIESVVAAKVTLKTSAASSSGTCSYRIEASPKIYDPVAGTLSLWLAETEKGQVPTGCRLLTTFLDRMVLAASVREPHMWYMSRQANPLDWLYGLGPGYSGRAIYGQETEYAGVVGQPITGMQRHMDDYLLMGCATSFFVFRGDPEVGEIDNLSDRIGVVDSRAICRGPRGETVFLSSDGLYMIGVEVGGHPESVSRERLPREMRDVDAGIYQVSMAYDVEFRGVHIYLVPPETEKVLHWWFDWEFKSFWPIELERDHEPMIMLGYETESPKETGLLLGCRDGYMRKYKRDAIDDDGVAFDSYCFYGPIRAGGSDYREGKIMEIIGTLAGGSGDVHWELILGESHESVGSEDFRKGRRMHGNWKAGRNKTERPRLRGGSFGLKVSGGQTDLLTNENDLIFTMEGQGIVVLPNVSGGPWSIETIGVVVKRLGRQVKRQ